MGCPTLPHLDEIERPNFLAVWKKSAGKENWENYYPFGLTFNSYNRENALNNPYQYNGKELQDELNLGWLDYQARQYDPAIARWMAPDPLSGLSRRWSPYAYCYDNPLLFVDPDGMFGDYYDQKGNKIGTDGRDDGRVYVVADKNEANKIKANDKAGQTTELNQINSGIELPSASSRAEMGTAVERSNSPNDKRTDQFAGNDDEGGFHEEGGIYGETTTGEEAVVHAKPGAKSDPLTDEKATVAPNDPADPANDNIYTQRGSFHVHPSGSRTPGPNTLGSSGSFVQSPTAPDDYREAKQYPGLSFVLGAGSKSVSIYRGGGSSPVATFPLKQFLSIGNQK